LKDGEREREKKREGEPHRILLFKLNDFAKRGELANFVFMLPLDGAGENRDKSPPISIVPGCGDISRLSRSVYVSGVRIMAGR